MCYGSELFGTPAPPEGQRKKESLQGFEERREIKLLDILKATEINKWSLVSPTHEDVKAQVSLLDEGS